MTADIVLTCVSDLGPPRGTCGNVAAHLLESPMGSVPICYDCAKMFEPAIREQRVVSNRDEPAPFSYGEVRIVPLDGQAG